MKHVTKHLIWLLFAMQGGTSQEAMAQTWPAKLNLASLFYLSGNFVGGIKGIVNQDGFITVTVKDSKLQTILYRVRSVVSSAEFSGRGDTLTAGQIGSGSAYYPVKWYSGDIKTAAFALDKFYADTAVKPYQFLYYPMDVQIIVESQNAFLQTLKIPGIGVVNAQGGNNLFDPQHYCYDLQKTTDCQCAGWLKVKQPDITRNSDLIVAAHRGIWGFDLGNSHPENSHSSVAATPPVTPVLESDVMITKDGRLIISHDYNLDRLSNYNGSDTDYLFNMYFNQVKDLQLRKRNEAISDDKYLDFGTLMDYLIQYKLVLTIDIKDIRARFGSDGKCVDNCDYDPATNPNAPAMIMASWKQIFRNCIQLAKEHNALSYIAFKVPHDFDTLRSAGVSDEDLAKVMYMPVIQPKTNRTALRTAINFVDSWNDKAGNRVLAFETNFKQLSSPYLQPFVEDGVHYKNLLNYVYARTGLRPGCYPEEPMGPRGIVSRWADWMIKDLGTDMRGDHYKLMSVPYGNIMVLTTDRPDVWEQIQATYNK